MTLDLFSVPALDCFTNYFFLYARQPPNYTWLILYFYWLQFWVADDADSKNRFKSKRKLADPFSRRLAMIGLLRISSQDQSRIGSLIWP